jgi:hypothetical protein
MANIESLTRPITKVVSVTAGATAFAGGAARALWVGVSGEVTITQVDGTSATLPAVAAGMWHPVVFTHITAAVATGLRIGY